jgi:hypothetical protein
MADPYLILVDGRVGGSGGVWNRFDVGRVMEFYTLPDLRVRAQPMFREFLAVSQATSIEAQTNIPIMLLMLCDFAADIAVANVLFEDAVVTSLPVPGPCSDRRRPTMVTRVARSHGRKQGPYSFLLSPSSVCRFEWPSALRAHTLIEGAWLMLPSST